MPVRRALWEEPVTESDVPAWHCPSCDGGYLKAAPNSLHFNQTAESKAGQAEEFSEPDWIRYVFVAILVCNNERCRESVAVSGVGTVTEVQYGWERMEYLKRFYPKHVTPSPPIIHIPQKCPVSVRSELEQSFVGSWGDFSSAGNHIRAAAERLLDALKEPKTRFKRNGVDKERVPLHNRIESLAKRDAVLGEALLAVKWLGNEASHTNKLSRKDIFDALDIFESVLIDLYDQSNERLKRLVKEINLAKGPIKIPAKKLRIRKS